jgi:SAM-dependent methyltransferase
MIPALGCDPMQRRTVNEQIVTGWRRVFSHPLVYESSQRAVGARSLRRTVAREYLRPTPGDRVLDLGCGPAYLLEFLPDTHYVGVDLSCAYIEHAKRTFGSQGKFLIADATRLEAHELEPFDLVTAVGLLHHLSDEAVIRLLSGTRARMSGQKSRFVTTDPCYLPGQSRIAAFLASRDRGRHVRSPQGYAALAQLVFTKVTVTVRHDLLRIPYTHCILELSH